MARNVSNYSELFRSIIRDPVQNLSEIAMKLGSTQFERKQMSKSKKRGKNKSESKMSERKNERNQKDRKQN